MARSRKTKSTKRSVDFSNAGKVFEKEQAYHLVVKDANWAEGQAGDYLAIEFRGVGEYENSSIYHNASMSPKALGRTRMMLEAMGYEISDDGDTDIDTADLIGLEVMGETYEDRYDGGKSIKVDDFYPVEDSGKSSKGKSSGKGAGKSSKKDEPELELDGLDEADLKKLAKALGINARRKDEDQLREAILEEGEDDIRAAAKKLKIDLDDAGDAEGNDDELDLGDVDEDDLKAIAKKLKVKGAAKMDEDDLREALGELDADDVRGEAEELDIDLDGGEPEEPKGKGKKGSSKGGSGKKSKEGFSEDAIQEMSEEQLEEVVEDHKLDVDLDKFKTLRKKQNAVIDALEAEGLIED